MQLEKYGFEPGVATYSVLVDWFGMLQFNSALTFLQNANAAQGLRANKQYNLLMLNDLNQFYDLMNIFELNGLPSAENPNYSGAAEYLYQAVFHRKNILLFSHCSTNFK
ncbi:hypothetical protein POM88_025737 [Heracleum sosnowskyi]|uniref:Uncharacterized protein n=1 Tax=Heracleum sosnowskyi TaxID=360622 RepID=A0AAD8MP69_9APIA|nr:hypothetical protein POM88_025737 [Heracleum sosnowskyi]